MGAYGGIWGHKNIEKTPFLGVFFVLVRMKGHLTIQYIVFLVFFEHHMLCVFPFAKKPLIFSTINAYFFTK